mgnify:CR=1 FL=1
MAAAGYQFSIEVSDAEEIHDPSLQPSQLTRANAEIKVTPVATRHPEAVVIGADTLVFLKGEPLGKPTDMAAAQGMLSRLVGRTHQVCTGVAIAHAGETHSFDVITEVDFKALAEGEISDYLQLIDPLDKAGAYAAQEHGERIIAETRGSFTNVIGLPMDELREQLASRFDIHPQMRDTAGHQ